MEPVIQATTLQLAHDPAHAPSYVERGNAYFELRDFDSAIADFEKAIELDPVLDLTYFGRGMALGRNGQIDAGIEDLNIYIQRNPGSTLAHSKRGIRHLWNGDAAGPRSSTHRPRGPARQLKWNKDDGTAEPMCVDSV